MICVEVRARGCVFNVEVNARKDIPIEDDQRINEIVEMLNDLLVAPIGTPGHRNDEAVNISCCLYALGIKDPWLWLEVVNSENDLIMQYDEQALKEAFERVEPYLESWNHDPENASIMNYTIDY